MLLEVDPSQMQRQYSWTIYWTMENINTNKSHVEARIPKTPHIVAQTNKKSPIVVTNIFILTVSFHSGMLYRLRPDYLVSTAHLKILFLYIILNFLSINLTSTIHVPGYPGAAVLRADLPMPLICKLKFYSTVFIYNISQCVYYLNL